jgi:hypothetical protein
VGRLTAPVNVAIAAAPGAGLTRIDLVYARVLDTAAIGGTLDELTVEKPLTGTAVSANPVPPALPASSEALAQIAVAAGTASITNSLITDRRRQAVLAQANFHVGGVAYTGTDGSAHISYGLPAGAKLVVAVASGVTGTGPYFFAMDATAGPVGGANAVWTVYNPAGSPLVSSGTIGIAYHVVYTF